MTACTSLYDVPAAVETALRDAMRADFFRPSSIDAALGWLRHRDGQLKGCPEILPADWATFQAVVDKARLEVEPTVIDPADVESDPETWGDEWDEWVWNVGPDPDEPTVDHATAPRHTDQDERDWAAMSPANASGFTVVRRRALPDFKPVKVAGRRAVVNDFSDFDRALTGAV